MTTANDALNDQYAGVDLTYRVVVGGLFHETHTFLEGRTSLKAFVFREREQILVARGDASPMGGFLEFASGQPWELVPTCFATATPSAIVADEVVEHFWKRFAKHAAASLARGADAIYLVLHGAFVSESFPDVEGELLQRIRRLPGAESIPIFGVYDLHANYSQAMADHANCLVAYRENPHWDARKSATRAASLLARSLTEGARPHQFLCQLPIIWPPTGTGSATNPMKRLLSLARKLEQENPELWSININAGFSFADTPDTGVSVLIVTDGDEHTAKKALAQLESVAMEHAEEGNVHDEPVEAVFDRLRQPADREELTGLTVLVEPSDNIGGGAPGDGTSLLRAIVDHEVAAAAICLSDPTSVAALEEHVSGDVIRLSLGGRGSRLAEGPLTLDCELLRVMDGEFELEDKQSHLASMSGDRFDMGRCAVVRHRGVTILLTSHRTPPMDLGQWRHVGLNPEEFSVIVVKAAVAHRKTYDPIAARQYWVDTPGPCTSRLDKLPYQNVRRPIYPLDAI